MEQVQDDVEIEPGEQTDAFVVSFFAGGGGEGWERSLYSNISGMQF